jgi:hypothetical protein
MEIVRKRSVNQGMHALHRRKAFPVFAKREADEVIQRAR